MVVAEQSVQVYSGSARPSSTSTTYSNPSRAVDLCKDYLTNGDFVLVRQGDVYGFMVEHYAKNNQYKPAYHLIEDMKENIPKVNVAYYINMQTIKAVQKALGVQIVSSQAGVEENNGEEDDEEEIADETGHYG